MIRMGVDGVKSDNSKEDERRVFQELHEARSKKKAARGRPRFAAAPTGPFFQDNQLKNQCPEISRKIFRQKARAGLTFPRLLRNRWVRRLGSTIF